MILLCLLILITSVSSDTPNDRLDNAWVRAMTAMNPAYHEISQGLGNYDSQPILPSHIDDY